MSERKAVIKNADMSEEMQQDAVDCATQALEKYNIEKVCQYTSYMLGWLVGWLVVNFRMLIHCTFFRILQRI